MITLLCTVRECHLPLAIHERRAACANGHSFDRARSGYWNLLQPQDRRSKSPGDSADAVNARRRFIDAGHSEWLVEATIAMLEKPRAILDVGCGEGHHLGNFRRAFDAEAHGTDISLPAIELAAKRWRDCTFVVANADRFLPYADASFDAVTSITARMTPAEFARVLEPGGVALVVIPAPDDVIELRAAVLGAGEERDRTERTIETFASHFTLARRERRQHRALLDRNAIRDVMASTYRGVRPRERERLEALGAMEVTASRDLLLFRKTR
jgi:23S rRNA (guanine745-N1)-methyltransferase